MKKSMLLVPMLLIGLALPTGAFADKQMTIVNDGKIVNGRTLVPMRVISEEFGSKVDWNQKLKTVTVNDGKKVTVLTANSKKITVDGKPATIDAPVQIDNGKTYVPLVVASPTGSEVEWDSRKKQARILFNDKLVVVNIDSPITDNQQLPKVSDSQKLAFIKKADEIANVPSIKQVRTYFKPYFTDTYINKIIYFNGRIDNNHEFKNSSTEQSIVYGADNALIKQMAQHYDGSTISRTIVLVRVDGVWKVDDIHFQVEFHDQQMNG